VEEAKDSHAFLIVVEPVTVGLGFEVGEEAEDAACAFVELHPHFLFELLAFVSGLVFHFRAYNIMHGEPKTTAN
jgi:hypothetical protein